MSNPCNRCRPPDWAFEEALRSDERSHTQPTSSAEENKRSLNRIANMLLSGQNLIERHGCILNMQRCLVLHITRATHEWKENIWYITTPKGRMVQFVVSGDNEREYEYDIENCYGPKN